MSTFRNTLYHLHTHRPMKMEQTKCFGKLGYKIQTPGNYPEESIQHSEHGESLKSRKTVQFPLIPVTKIPTQLSRLISVPAEKKSGCFSPIILFRLKFQPPTAHSTSRWEHSGFPSTAGRSKREIHVRLICHSVLHFS